MPVVVPPPFTRAPYPLARENAAHGTRASTGSAPYTWDKPSRYNGRGPQPATAPCMCGAVHRLAQGGHRMARRRCSQQTHRSL